MNQETNRNQVNKNPLNALKLIGVLSLSLSGLISTIPNFAIAAPIQNKSTTTPKPFDKAFSKPKPTNNSNINAIVFKPRPNQGRQLETLGAGTRSNGRCVAEQSPNQPESASLALLTPKLSENLTVSDRPTFWFYLPKTVAKTLEFSLFENTPNTLGEYKTGIYQVSLPIEQKETVTGYQLPPNAPALAPGKKYEWAIALVCEPNNRQRDLNASGTITRIQLSAEQQNALTQASALEQSEFFARNGIWSDMITAISVSDRQLVNQVWQELLKLEQSRQP